MDFNYNKKGSPMTEILFFVTVTLGGDYVIAMIWLSRLLS